LNFLNPEFVRLLYSSFDLSPQSILVLLIVPSRGFRLWSLLTFWIILWTYPCILLA